MAIQDKFESGFDWFASIVRVAGASFPGTSSLVQLQSEIESKSLLKRIEKLEDPISFLHEEVPNLSKLIYEELKTKDNNVVTFETEFYSKYSRPLAALESQGLIKGNHTIGNKYYAGITLCDPSYIMYLCAIGEDKGKMEKLIKTVDECAVGKWLDGKELKSEIGLPIPVIQAVFEIYESKGYGLRSKQIGIIKYLGKA